MDILEVLGGFIGPGGVRVPWESPEETIRIVLFEFGTIAKNSIFVQLFTLDI